MTLPEILAFLKCHSLTNFDQTRFLTAKSGSKNHFVVVVVLVVVVVVTWIVVVVGVGVVVLCTFQPRVFLRLSLAVMTCLGRFLVINVSIGVCSINYILDGHA